MLGIHPSTHAPDESLERCCFPSLAGASVLVRSRNLGEVSHPARARIRLRHALQKVRMPYVQGLDQGEAGPHVRGPRGPITK